MDGREEHTTVLMPWRHPALWAYISAYALGAMPLGFILYDSSLYLHARFAWNQATLGKVLWIPPFGWEVGYFVWGWLIDRFGPRFRTLMPVCLGLSLPLAWMHSLPTGAWVLGEMFLAMFALAGFVVLAVAYATRVFSSDHAGLVAGRFVGGGDCSHQPFLRTPFRPVQVRRRLPHRNIVPGCGLSAVGSPFVPCPNRAGRRPAARRRRITTTV